MPSPWSRGWSTTRPRPDMRVSDAERSEVADRLSEHFSSGRLDQAEFDERLEKAMHAKTRADLDGLFDDLPDLSPPAPTGPPPPRYQRRGPPRLVFLAFIVFAVFLLSRSLLWPFTRAGFFGWHWFGWPLAGGGLLGVPFFWIIIGVVVFLWLRGRDRRHYRP